MQNIYLNYLIFGLNLVFILIIIINKKMLKIILVFYLVSIQILNIIITLYIVIKINNFT